MKELPHIRNLPLADPTFDSPGKIDFLLGGDILPQVILPEMKTGASNTPMAWLTIFGWAIFGPFRHSKAQSRSHQSCSNHFIHEDEESTELLKQFWEIEEVPLTATTEEEEAQLHYNNTHVYLHSDSRYQVTLPIKTDLGESKTQALQRFRANKSSTIRKGTWIKFQQVIQEYLDLDHARPVQDLSRTNLTSSPYYLPMHAVLKESSTRTKLRVVFDASAKTSTGTSLNETLMVGPTLHPTLETVLLRFRSYSIALTGDISKMYRAIELSPTDRHLHRFLWRKTLLTP